MTTETKTITKADLNDKNEYALSDDLDFNGHIVIEAELGFVRFRGSLIAKNAIIAKAGSGIKAGWGIKAGEGILTGWLGLTLKDLSAKWIDAKLRIAVGFNCKEAGKINGEIRHGEVILGIVETNKGAK